MLAESSLQSTVLLAALTLTFVIIRHWRKDAGTGLLLTYLLSFGTIHLLAPVLYLIPWYGDSRIEPTIQGLRQSTIAMVAFAVGAEVGAVLSRRYRPAQIDAVGYSHLDSLTANLYLWSGLFVYAVMIPLAKGVPTLTALVSMALPMIVAAMCAKCWAAWHEGRQVTMWTWIAASAAFPVLTVLT